jgi:hypothetical protein
LLGDLPAGIDTGGPSHPLVAFEVDEAHPNWKTLEALLEEWDAGDFVRTAFTHDEIRSASWVEIEPEWEFGYPQPKEDSLGYLDVTYDSSDGCRQCGVGFRQKAPFQMKKEPRWGRRSIFSMYWVHDEFFVSTEAWNDVFKKHGIRCRAVHNTKEEELKTVVQLVADEEVDVAIADAAERCPRCKRDKIQFNTRGPFPPVLGEPSKKLVKTVQYFGSGGSAWKGVLIAQDVARDVLAHGIRGARLVPCSERSTEDIATPRTGSQSRV